MSTPGPPNLVLQPYSSPNAIEYAWDAPSQPNGTIIAYKLVLSTGGSAVYTNSSIPPDWYGYYVGPPEFTLTNGITYSATLQAINENGEGEAASFQDFQAGTAPYLPPSTATAVISGTNSALVSWAPPAQDLDATIFWYTILSRSTNPADPVFFYTADGLNTRSYYISGLNPESQYSFDINAVNCPGYSPTATTNTIGFITPFGPANLNGLELWLDASATSNFVLSGSNVTQWNDKSGRGRNATKHSTNNPVYNSNALSNKGAVYIASSAYSLRSVIPSQTFASSITIFGIIQKTGDNTYDSPYSRTVGAQPGALDIYDNVRLVGNGAGTFLNIFSQLNLNAINASTLIHNINATPTTAVEWSNAINVLNSNGSYSYVDTATNFFIGTRGDLGTGFTGNYGEIILYSSTLTSFSRQQMEGYLAWKWGLQTNLYLGHPFRYSAPTNQNILFVPSLLSNLTLWLDAADSNAFTLSGSNVTQWRDKSGNANNFSPTQGTPTRITDGSLTVVDISGNVTIQGTTSVAFNTNFSIFIVTKVTAIPNGFGNLLGIGNNKVIRYYSPNNQLNSVQLLGGPSSSGNSDDIITTAVVNGDSTRSATPSSTYSVYHMLDGPVANGSTGPPRLSDSSFGRYFYGRVCEVLVYSTPLTTSNRQTVQGYLAWKWGINNLLPANHPYKNQPPYYP